MTPCADCGALIREGELLVKRDRGSAVDRHDVLLEPHAHRLHVCPAVPAAWAKTAKEVPA